MDLRPAFVLFCLFATAAAAAQQAYRWVDEDGVVHFSDRPREGAEVVQLQAPNVATLRRAQRAPATSGDEADEADEADEPAVGYTSIEILSPRAEETLWNIEGVLNVSVALQPGLKPGHQVRAYFDGEMRPVSGTSFQLQEVWRGVHNIQVEVVDATGKVMIRSQPSRFYVQQNTVAF
ncbi:MAG TPA: DUF4124 domain-containing protein [Woeseiaceae bacterium]|nr:DUF4124 domain-containing protein [Woeseiaceae bacterium]